MITLHKNINNLDCAAQGGVLVIGNFDGLHRGHRMLIDHASAVARKAGVPLCVMTFEPHPRAFFQKSGEPFRLTMLPEKMRIFGEWGVDHLIVPEFDAAFAALTADQFIRDILVQKLAVHHVVVGADFKFGAKRGGSVETLEQAAEQKLFGFTPFDLRECPHAQPYSSTRIRAHLRAGEFDAAAALLGRPWMMESEIIHGDKRGRELGYPTANQNAGEYVRIPFGVYAVRVEIDGIAGQFDGAANFGIRPMFKTADPLLETFIFDFTDDVYGKKMKVQPIRHLRPEMSFMDIDGLIRQIKQDCEEAKAVLKIAADTHQLPKNQAENLNA